MLSAHPLLPLLNVLTALSPSRHKNIIILYMLCNLRRYRVLDKLYGLNEAEKYSISKSIMFCVTQHLTQQSTERGSSQGLCSCLSQ